jgi:hypothetical protein
MYNLERDASHFDALSAPQDGVNFHRLKTKTPLQPHRVKGQLSQPLQFLLLSPVGGDTAPRCLLETFVATYVVKMAVGYERDLQVIGVESHPLDVADDLGHAFPSARVDYREAPPAVDHVDVAVPHGGVTVTISPDEVDVLSEFHTISLDTNNSVWAINQSLKTVEKALFSR